MNLNTFSIAARCEETGRFGVAVSTAVPAVGALCPFAKSGVGAIATQAWVNPTLGEKGLTLLASGMSAEEVLEGLLAEDPGCNCRQLGIVDAKGGSAAYTGSETEGYQGHLTGVNYSVQGNMLTGPETLEAMEASFQATTGDLAERLMQALEAGQAAGGDKRGKVSAAIKVVDIEGFPYCDLRVDEHENPVGELRRILDIQKNGLMGRYHAWVQSVQEGKKSTMKEMLEKE